MTRTAAKALVDTLVAHGVDRAFCVPGESYLGVVDALYADPVFELVPCRHEGGAAFMAMADAKVTGRPGILFVSRGPGATNAAIGIHAAEQDGQPLIVFLGQVGRNKLGRRALQEVDYGRTFGPICKWVEEVHRADRLPEAAARAFQKAMSGTPGPVIVAMPTDILDEPVEAATVKPRPIAMPKASAGEIESLADRLAAAERPILLAGTGARSARTRKALAAASHAWQVPVMASFENQDVFDNLDPNYAGLLGLRPPPAITATARESDLVIAVGTNLDDVTTQGFSVPGPDQALIQVDADADVIGHNFNTQMAVVSSAAELLEALASRNPPPPPAGRAGWIETTHQRYLEISELHPRAAEDGIDFGHVIGALNEHLPDDAIVTCDAGSFASWLDCHFRFRPNQILLGAVSGAMGFGVPAAVAAALRHPDRKVVALAGDGGMMMTGAELATAMRQGANITVIVSNNAAYGTIRFHQENRYPGRDMGTELANPDFAALARAYGARGYTIDSAEAAADIVAEALAGNGSAVVDVRTSLENVTASATISGLRSA
jgi:acetolactate synthase-1/2/3 large subunit